MIGAKAIILVTSLAAKTKVEKPNEKYLNHQFIYRRFFKMHKIRYLDEHFEEILISLLLILISFVMMFQVIMRYVFNMSLTWSEELTRFSFIWSAFLSIGYCIKKGVELKIDIIYQSFLDSTKRTLDIIVSIIMILFYGYALYFSFEVVKISLLDKQTSPAMRLPMYFIYFSTVIGFFLALLRSIQVLLKKQRSK